MGEADNEVVEDPTPPDTRAAQLPDDPEDEIYLPPEDAVNVSPPVDVVTIDHAEVLEPPQVDPETEASPSAADDDTPTVPDGSIATHTLRVHGLFRLPDLSAADAGVTRAKRQVTTTLTAVYHDTDDLRLARWGVTLRRWDGGDDPGWHLELPVAGAQGRPEEVRLPASAGEAGDVPHENWPTWYSGSRATPR